MEEDKIEDHEFTINSWCWTRKKFKADTNHFKVWYSEETSFK